MRIEELLNIIRKEFPDKALEVSEGLELLSIIIEDTIDIAGLKVNDSFSKKQYDKVPYYSNIAELLCNYNKKITDMKDILDSSQSSVKTLKGKNIEYSLKDDFTNKKPYAFSFQDKKYIKSKTWKDILVKTCEILIEKDEEKFMNFEKLEHMNGRKKQYFSKNLRGMSSPRNIYNKIYVETNLSANAIRNLLIKILKEYNIDLGDLKIYIRQDY